MAHLQSSDRMTLIDAALNVCDCIENLRHPKHAVPLAPLRKEGRKTLSDFFYVQGADVLDHLKPRLNESDSDSRKRAELLIPDNFAPLIANVGDALGADWSQVLQDAIRQAGETIAAELGINSDVSETFMGRYLRVRSLNMISSDIAPETVKQLRNAILDAYSRNASVADIEQVIRDVYERFSTARASTIAQTELNDAYNAGRFDVAVNAGMNEKSWATESKSPCVVCLANQAQGWIPIDKPFQSGHQKPTGHPNCYCSVDFRLTSRTKKKQKSKVQSAPPATLGQPTI